MVETGSVKMHRTFGWFVAGYAPVVIFIAIWAELSWQALNLHTPGALPAQFLSIAYSGPLCLALLLPYGILLRRNSAAHRRVLILAAICISDAGFARLMDLFLPPPTTFWGTYFFYESGTLLIILLILLWDLKKNRVMKQFLQAAAVVITVGLTATWLFFNATWQAITTGWLVAWARHM